MLLRIRWRSLRNKIILWSFVPTTIILLAVALVTFDAYQKVTEDLVTGRDRELARLSAAQLVANMTEYSDILTSLARTADVYRGAPTYQRATLERARNRLVVFDAGVVILDSHGKVAAELDRLEILGQDWSNRNYFRQILRSQRTAFSDVVADGPQGADVITVAVPIAGEQGEFVGAIAGMFRVDANSTSSFYGGIVKLRTADRGEAYVVDGNGRVIYHSNTDRNGEDMSARPVVQQVLSGKVGNMRTRDSDGREIVAYFAPVPRTSWGLVIQENWDVLVGSSQGYRQFLMFLLVLGVVAPVLFVTFGVKRITEPIRDLIDATGEVARGKFGQTIKVESGDELEELAKHFNLMSAQLQESYSDLEQKVADRTKELSAINAIAGVVSRVLELEDILDDALDKTLEVTAMDAGGAFRSDENGQTMTLVAHRGLSDEIVRHSARLPVESSTSRLAASRSEPVVMRVADHVDPTLKSMLERQGFQLVVSVPLMAKGKALGTINLATRNLRSLAPEELSLLASIGHQIGIAVENAQLYEEAGRSAAAAERSRLARDLHDAVTQTLFSASLIAEVLPRLWERNPDEGRRRLEELRQLTRGALAEMRTLLLELRPAALTEVGLGDLLRQLAEAITGRARVPVTLSVEGQNPLASDVQIAFYRIAQEALNNAAKHASAKHISVTLRSRPGRVELWVSDDGCGFDPKGVAPGHLGVGIMRERAEAIGATVNITSKPGHGTMIAVMWQDHLVN